MDSTTFLKRFPATSLASSIVIERIRGSVKVDSCHYTLSVCVVNRKVVKFWTVISSVFFTPKRGHLVVETRFSDFDFRRKQTEK